ncbi:MAG: hypothetical protein V3R73_00910, partial [Sphingomonadales bacterium]
NRLYSAGQFAEADVNHGQGRYEARLVALLGPAVAAVPGDGRPSALAYQAKALAFYGRTSELLAVMRELNDAWNRGRYTLEALAKRGDIATALVIAEREMKPHLRFKALNNIITGLVQAGNMAEARQVFAQTKVTYESLTGYYLESYKADYLAVLAHFDAAAAERQALSIGEARNRRSAILNVVRVLGKTDPGRALEMTLVMRDEMYRGFAMSSVLRDAAKDPSHRAVFERALARAGPLQRAYAHRNAARNALEKGELARVSEELDRLEAIIPGLSAKDRGRVANRVVIRLAAEVLSGDVSRVFHKMAGLVYDDNLSQSSAVWVMAGALRQNGYHELGAQVVEVLRGKTNYAGYFIAAINERYE